MDYPTPNQFIYITNAGAHFSVTSPQDNDARKALQILLKSNITPKLTEYLTTLKTHITGSAFQQVIALFNKGYVSAKDYSTELKEQSLEVSLPTLLAHLSSNQHCLLCDQEGFLIAYSSFDRHQAEQAAILAIEISGLQEKRQHNINQFSGTHSSFISIADIDGNTTMRFLPLSLNQQTFVLAIQGKASVQKDSFTQLIWLLSQRYL